ncbi:MAG: hypothetical protein JW902_00105 [Syntrophaceae bacterium]|nr:hypothetical protein [Syntrophaceae bacterium]
MNDPQYWTSFWGLLIILCLAFVALFASSAVIVYLYDRISVLPVWNSPFWIRFKIPIIILAVISFLAALIAYIRYEDKKELQLAQQYALSQEWGFAKEATPELKDLVSEILRDWRITIRYVRTVENGVRRIWLFDCSYKDPEASAKSSYTQGVGCLIQSNRFLSSETPVEIATRDWTEVMISDKVDMGNSPFAEKFIVLSKDAASAYKIVNESLQAFMLEYFSDPDRSGVGVIIGNRGAVLLTGRVSKQEELYNLLELAKKIEAAAR